MKRVAILTMFPGTLTDCMALSFVISKTRALHRIGAIRLTYRRDRYANAPDSKPVKTWRRGNCGEVHAVTARDYKWATTPDGKVA